MATKFYSDLGRLKGGKTVAKNSVVMMQEGIQVKHLLTGTERVPIITHDGVQFTPNFIEFNEASEGITRKQRIIIKNIGVKPALIRIYEPNSIAFQVQTMKRGVMLNPGLHISTTVTYCFKQPSFLRAIIPIEINGKIVDYQVVCKLFIEGISAAPHSIDFGFVDIGYSAGIKVITLKNEGGKSTRFSIDLGTNELEITVKPMRGIVKPNKQVKLKVELIGMHEGVYYSEFWIKSVPNIRIPFKINVIVPRLVIYHPNATGDFTLIDFSTAVANTRKYDSFVLRNISSQVASYVVLGEIDNELKCIRDIDRRYYPVYSAFNIRPIQGRIGPFEGIIFEVAFTPTENLMKPRKELGDKVDKSEHDFMAFLRIVRVHVTETQDFSRFDLAPHAELSELLASYQQKREDVPIMNESASSTTSVSSLISAAPDVVRLCLHGEVAEGRLTFEPDVLHFGEICVGEESQRVVRISNPLKFAPLFCRYVQTSSVHCSPKSMTLKPRGSEEVLVKIQGRESVKPMFKIYFDVEADSCESSLNRRKSKIKVGSYAVQCAVKVMLLVTIKKSCMPIVRSIFGTDYKEITTVPKKTQKKSVIPPSSLVDCTATEKYFRSKISEKVTRIPKLEYKNVSEEIFDCELIARKMLSKKRAGRLSVTSGTEILIPLTPLQIYNVRMYPTLFSFGTVVPKSRNYRQLIVENLNDVPVMIRLTNLSSRSVTFPQGNLLILPPGSLLTRLVEFRAQRHTGKFNGYIDYIINDNHSFELAVIANIVDKQLSLDTREIAFCKNFLKEEVYQPLDYAIRIKNKLGAKTSFRWEIPATCCFFVEPMSGTVRGFSSLYTYVCYKPDVTKITCSELILKCENNSYIAVRLIMPTRQPKVSFLKDVIDVGEIPLNLPSKAIALLRNFEYTEVEFIVDSTTLIRGCVIEPAQGVLAPRGIVPLEICLTFNYCFHFNMMIRVAVQKTTILQFKIMGTVTFPELRLLPRSIHLKRVSASASQHHLITVSNVGTTMLKLQFLLEEYPEFRVSRSPRKQHPDIGKEETFVPPGTTKELHLHFQPTDLASYAFYLPIVINDILGPALLTNSKTLKPSEYLKSSKEFYSQLSNFVMMDIPSKFSTIFIDCTIAQHIVFFNNLIFRFNVFTNKVSDEFSIENRDSVNETSVLIDTSNFSTDDCPFSICWIRGEEPTVTPDYIQCILQQGQQCCFTLEFQPRTRGNFYVEAPIFIEGEMDGEMFNKLCISGEYHEQTIHCEYSEIYFEPVPLKTSTEKVFRLNTRYFERDTTIVSRLMTPDRCSGVYTDDMLSVNFIDNNIATSPHSELEVRITFSSKLSVSFRTVVVFSDEDELVVCPVWIYATADNSLLTIHAFIRNRMSLFEWATNQDKRTSRNSKLSDSNTDEDENGVHPARNAQISVASMHVLSYFSRRSRVSIEKLMEYKYKLGTGDKTDSAHETEHSTMETDDDATLDATPNKHDVASTIASSTTTFEKLYEPVQYPFYPFGNENQEYEVYMNQTVDAVEEWLYSGPFKFNYHPDIPIGIAMALEDYLRKRQSHYRSTSRRSAELGRSFVDVLESLLGPSIYNHIVLPKTLPEKDVERANCMCTLYESILNFLMKRGAHLCHVSPQFLLNYNEYHALPHTTRSGNSVRKLHGIFPVEKKLSWIKFISRSKQCWLDVLLQTYKCIILSDITELRLRTESNLPNLLSTRRSTVHRASIASSITSLRKHYEIHDVDIDHMEANISVASISPDYSTTEMFLLGWLNYHYEEQRMMDWLTDRRLVLSPYEPKDMASERKIENFDSNLADSLVLITVTVAYCSFLIEEYFSNIYLYPRNNEELLHNAICLVNAWRQIRLGFIITPMEIVYPNCIKMVMLVAYLFNILPTYIPRSKVKFSCQLTETVIRQISFTNPTGQSVGYLLVFFGNSSGFFRAVTPQSVIRLSGHKSTVISIEFHARKIKKTRAYLLFCGSTIGPYFGRNQTFILEGRADDLAISSEYTISSGLYQVVDKILVISVPYENSAEYEIWMTEQQPSQARSLRQTRWSELCLRKIPRRLFINQKTITVNEDSNEASLSVTVACITPINRKFWIIFQSKLGDFIIQINSRWHVSLTENIVVEWDQQVEKCLCTEEDYNEICPLSLIVPIPSRNKQLWSCVARMFQKTLDPKERMFWSRYLDTHIGLRLIRWLMGDSVDAAAKEFSHIFDSTVTYNVTISETTCIFSFPKTFTINDVRPFTENIPMKIHISPLTERLCEIILTLISIDGSERRTYMISFLHYKSEHCK